MPAATASAPQYLIAWRDLLRFAAGLTFNKHDISALLDASGRYEHRVHARHAWPAEVRPKRPRHARGKVSGIYAATGTTLSPADFQKNFDDAIKKSLEQEERNRE